MLGHTGSRLADRARLKGIRFQADDIVRTAREKAASLEKEAELKAKEDLIHQREVFKQETEQIRGELREQERRLDKPRRQPGGKEPESRRK